MLITLTTCNTAFEANLIKGMLQTNGIDCFLTNENFTTLMPYYNGMLGSGVQVMIDDSDLDQAKELLPKPQNENEIICPECKSTNVDFGLGTKKWKKVLIVFLSLLTWLPLGNISNTFYCKDCGTEFKNK